MTTLSLAILLAEGTRGYPSKTAAAERDLRVPRELRRRIAAPTGSRVPAGQIVDSPVADLSG